MILGICLVGEETPEVQETQKHVAPGLKHAYDLPDQEIDFDIENEVAETVDDQSLEELMSKMKSLH